MDMASQYLYGSGLSVQWRTWARYVVWTTACVAAVKSVLALAEPLLNGSCGSPTDTMKQKLHIRAQQKLGGIQEDNDTREEKMVSQRIPQRRMQTGSKQAENIGSMTRGHMPDLGAKLSPARPGKTANLSSSVPGHEVSTMNKDQTGPPGALMRPSSKDMPSCRSMFGTDLRTRPKGSSAPSSRSMFPNTARPECQLPRWMTPPAAWLEQQWSDIAPTPKPKVGSPGLPARPSHLARAVKAPKVGLPIGSPSSHWTQCKFKQRMPAPKVGLPIGPPAFIKQRTPTPGVGHPSGSPAPAACPGPVWLVLDFEGSLALAPQAGPPPGLAALTACPWPLQQSNVAIAPVATGMTAPEVGPPLGSPASAAPGLEWAAGQHISAPPGLPVPAACCLGPWH